MDNISLLKYGLNFFELLSCIAGFFYWRKIKDSYWKWFPVYLAIIVITELTAKYIGVGLGLRQLNVDLYRFFGIPIQFLFFCWLFYRYFSSEPVRKWVLLGAGLYIVCWFVDFLYFSNIRLWFLSFSYTMGNIILLVMIFMFFIKFINSDEILKYRSSMMFWVCVGLLVFYLGTFPFYGLRNTLYKSFRPMFYVYWYISFVLAYFMYILFAIAFVWGKPK